MPSMTFVLCSIIKQHPPTDGPKADARWKDYYRMNEAFADKVSQVYKAGDVIMVHDYYLISYQKCFGSATLTFTFYSF